MDRWPRRAVGELRSWPRAKHLSLGADLCPVSQFKSIHCPTVSSFATNLQIQEVFATGVRSSEVRLVTALLGNQEGGKKRVV